MNAAAASIRSERLPALEQELRVRGDLTTYQYRLPNGLAVFLTPNPAAPSVSIVHWVKAGSLHETPGITGIAQLFEHMMFRPVARVHGWPSTAWAADSSTGPAGSAGEKNLAGKSWST